jgi:two-component system, NarL family, response regulator NreC
MNRIRVLLAEDHETVRQGLRLLLESQDDIEVIAEASNGRSAVQNSQTFQPHVVILDISMPEMNGLVAAKAIKEVAPDVAIVALTRHDDQAFVQELTAAGATGYVLKQSRSTELLNAIRTVARGGRYIDPKLADPSSSPAHIGQRRGGYHPPSISDRERNVLRMMAIGHSNKEIAAALTISIKTVEVHKANAMRKLGLHGRIDVVRYAVLHGWLQEP